MQVSILMVRALAGVIERSGASRERFLSVAGIDPRWIDEGTMRLPIADYVRAIDAAIAVSGDPAFGLHLGEQARSAMFDVLGPLTEHAGTLRQSIVTSGRYARLLAEGHELELHEAGDTASFRIPALRGDWTAVRMTAELAMTAMLPALELFVGVGARPTEVCFAYPQPPYAAEYQRIFGDAARFDQPFTEMVFSRAWLDKAQPYASAELYAVLKAQADRSLDRIERNSALSERIMRILASFEARPFTMEDVAREVGISTRSLRRKMLSEGVSFNDLVARNRMHVAKRMLERPGASIQETAYAMGFASPAAFHRAFKRWTGLTPKQYQESF
jgi:AraC-like DNA-binding protein